MLAFNIAIRRENRRESAAERRKPNSVPHRDALRRHDETTIIPLAPSLLTGSSSLPGDSLTGSVNRPPRLRAVALVPLFGLAPCGVLPATDVATGAVRSYRTFSPLPYRRV